MDEKIIKNAAREAPKSMKIEVQRLSNLKKTRGGTMLDLKQHFEAILASS